MSIEYDGLLPQEPRSPRNCSRYAQALPRLQAGELSSTELVALGRHVRTCAACRAIQAAQEVSMLDASVRRHYSIPQGRAPFLRMEDVLARVARDSDDAQDQLAEIPRESQEFDEHQAQEASVSPLHLPGPVESRNPGVLGRGRSAVAAAVAIAALFALILHVTVPTHITGGAAFPTSTPIVLHYLGSSGSWTISGPELLLESNLDTFVVAPSNPLTRYKTIVGSLVVQRSDDGGITWKEYRLPADKVGGVPFDLSLSVSPLDARIVFAIVISSAANPNCPRPVFASSGATHIGALSVARPHSGGYSCTFEYVSTDSGATWQRPVVPASGDIGESGLGLQPAFQAQGGRLFSLLVPDVNGTVHAGYSLLSSVDGVHWQAADAQLITHGVFVFSFVATPSGRTLFATTIPYNASEVTQRHLWRSDDAGASWRDLGPFQTGDQSNSETDLAAAAIVEGKTRIYVTTMQFASHALGAFEAGVPTLHVSDNDGRTWQDSPAAGLPKGKATPTPVAVGVLPDGTVVLQFVTRGETPGQGSITTGNLVMYGWKPGDSAWTQLTPVIPGEVGFRRPAWLVQPTSGQPAGVWTVVDDGNSVKVEYCRLTS